MGYLYLYPWRYEHECRHRAFYPELAGPLSGCRTICMVAIVHAMPVLEVAWLVLPHLPAQMTAHQLRRETLHPACLLEWSTVWGGREALARLLPKLVYHTNYDGHMCYMATGSWTSWLGRKSKN